MNQVKQKVQFLLMGSDSWSYHQRIDKIVKDVQQMVATGLISDSEALVTFNSKLGY